MPHPTGPNGKQLRGFARMSKAQRAENGRTGGRAAHSQGRAHQFTSEEAREAAARSVIARRAKADKAIADAAEAARTSGAA